MLLKKDFEGGLRATLIQDQGQTRNLDSKIYLPGFHRFKFEFHSFFAETFSTVSTQSGHWLAFYVAARSESQLYQNICLSRYDAVSSAAGGWPVNGAPPFSLPDARRQHRGSSVSPRGRPS